ATNSLRRFARAFARVLDLGVTDLNRNHMRPGSNIRRAPDAATGVINFINFTFSAFLGPVFGSRLVQMPEGDVGRALAHYQAGFKPLLYGIIVAVGLTFFLKETGLARRKAWV